ncbi:MAG: sigma-70 family RNA polymerase sigma factor [Acidobacteria bacterium]|nr:sigma-70 family RNA polymerase sigma factor [Acidobacteriota bacterium]
MTDPARQRTLDLDSDTTLAPDAADSPTVLEALVENHRAFLRFLERRVGSRETAEDLLQDAFGRALDRLDTIRGEESAVAWFYRVLRNAIVDHYRRHDASRRAIDAFARELDEVVPPADVQNAICECVSTLARTLKPEYAEALRQIDVHGVPVKDFAARSGISAGNAAVRVHRAREALRKQVVASCGTCAEHGCLDCRCRKPRRPPL